MMIPREPDDPRLTRIALRSELVEDGWSDRALCTQVRAGTLVRPRRGAYVDGPAWRSLDARGRHELTARSVVRQASTRLVVSHTSALPFLGCPDWGLDLSEVHVTRADGEGSRREAGVRPHRGRLSEADVVLAHGTEVTEPHRAALEAATVLGMEAGVVQVTDLLHRGLITLPGLWDLHQTRMAVWPHSLSANVLLRLVDPRCESVGEARTLFLCWRQGLPAPDPQYEVRDASGKVVYRVDFAWPELGVFLEFDGKVKYAELLRAGESITDVVLREKKREEEICRLTGWRCIRITWADLQRPEATALMIRRILFEAGAAA